jgi:nicotinamide-nucleotide amidase
LEDPLEVQVGQWLRRREMKLVAAESCTGGLIGHRITDVPGSSDYYLGSVIAYAYEAKERLLSVDHETLTRFGAVSAQVVLEMASGARQALAGDFPIERLVGLSVSGIAGPGGGMPGKPVGLTWIGLSAPEFDCAWSYVWEGDRAANKQQSAEQALRLLLDYLQGKVKMALDPVTVTARWDASGRFIPSQFVWQGREYAVESTGRRWEDEAGLHVLCMVAGGQVFELVFHLQPAGWSLRAPMSGSQMA